MDTYRTVLFLHLVALAIGFGAGSVLLVCLLQLRAAQTLADAVPWGAVAGKTEKAFPVAIVGLFASGAYMTSHVWTWSTGWIDVSIAGLVLISLQGPLVGGRHAKLLERALHENGPGPLAPGAREPRGRLRDRLEHDAEAGDGRGDRRSRRGLRAGRRALVVVREGARCRGAGTRREPGGFVT